MKVWAAVLVAISLAISASAYNELCIGVPNLTYVRSPQACYLYYGCIDGEAFGYTCPEDLWFSLELQRCVEQEESDCNIDQPPELPEAPPRPPSPECDDVDNFSYLASLNSCQFYYQCIDNIAYLLSCPQGLWFSQDLQRCGNRLEIECDLLPPTPGPPGPQNVCFGRPNFSFVSDLQYCHRFTYCLNGSPFPMVCDDGLHFNELEQSCTPADSTPCNGVTVPPDTTPTPGICTGVTNGDMVINPDFCNRFYICNGGDAAVALCPDGLWFDVEQQDCGHPMDVFCPHGPATTPTPDVCSGVEDGLLVASPNNCNSYYVCAGEIGYNVYCPPGEWFNESIQDCDLQENVICMSEPPTPPIPTTTPGPPGGIGICANQENGTYLPNPTDCSMFFICFNGNSYPSTCLGGLFFNPETSLCDLAENVECTPTPSSNSVV